MHIFIDFAMMPLVQANREVNHLHMISDNWLIGELNGLSHEMDLTFDDMYDKF